MMTPQENQALQDFLNQLVQVRGIAKDSHAEALIMQAVAQQPDAVYLLVQRAMLLEQALNQSKAQIAHLQQELQVTRSSSTSSFLNADAWGNSAATMTRPAVVESAPSAFSQHPAPAAQPSAPAMTRPGFFGSNAGSFLTNVAATAAGVAGGAFLFQGIESLMGHHHGSGFFGQSGLMSTPAENTTHNNEHAANVPLADSSDDSFAALDFNDDGSGEDGLTDV